MGKLRLYIVAGVAVLVALAFVLNPSAERHRNAIKDTVADRSPIAGTLGVGALAAFTSTYHSWGFFSYTTVSGRVASIGVFGIVHVRDLLPG